MAPQRVLSRIPGLLGGRYQPAEDADARGKRHQGDLSRFLYLLRRLVAALVEGPDGQPLTNVRSSKLQAVTISNALCRSGT